MKKILISCYLSLMMIISISAFAGGGLTHMYVAHTAIDSITDPKLRNLLLDNLDAYLVGAYYPDSGFAGGNHYGEDSHWDPFVFTFADYIKETYPDPATTNPKIVAFLFGIASHRVSDEIMHWTFYHEVRDHDFPDDYPKAHAYGDTGIDLLVNIDENQWFTQPKTWWVPVKDLVAVYHRMGKDEYTADEIIRGNALISLAGTGERIISAPAYPYLRWKMPWTAKNYVDDPEGGLLIDETQIASYQMMLWDRLNNKNAKFPLPSMPKIHLNEELSPALNFANNAVTTGALTINYQTNSDGSVEIFGPTIVSVQKFKELLNELKEKLVN